MNKKYWNFKDSLVAFFQDLGYLIYGTSQTKKTTYLYAKSETIQLIKVALVQKNFVLNDQDGDLEYLQKELEGQLNNETPINRYEIYFGASLENQVIKNSNQIIILANNWSFFIENVKQDFPKITSLDNLDLNENTSNTSQKLVQNDFNIEDIKSAEELEKKLSLLNRDVKKSQTIGTMLIFMMFAVVPLIIGIVGNFFTAGLILNSSNAQNEVQALVFGATTYPLTMLGGQWWRVFTFGFSASGNFMTIIFMIVFSWLILKRLRLNELMMGTWKMLLAFFIAYLMLGLFVSVFSTEAISGSSGLALAITIGMLALNTGGSHSTLASAAKRQLIWPILWLVIIGLFSSPMVIMTMVVGFIAGGAVSMMFTYDYKEINWRLVAAILIILGIILTPVILLIIPSYVPGTNNAVLYSLGQYIRMNLLSADKANGIIDRIGWDNVSLNHVGDVIWIGPR